MFKTMRRQLDRPPATGKAKIFRRIIISSIFIATFFIFQNIQLGQAERALATQITEIKAATAASKENAEGLLKQYESKFEGSSEKLFADKAFSEEPLSGRISNGIEFETRAAQQESIQARGTVVLFDIFQFVLPGAVNMVQEHDKQLADFFASEEYTSSVEANAKVIDLNAAIQYCQGTPLELNEEKKGYGYAEGEAKYLTPEQLKERADAINAAADRTICADIPDFKQ
jgi:hypothetical protein